MERVTIMSSDINDARAYKRFSGAYRFFRPIITPFIKLKFNYTFDPIKDVEGPFLLLINHNLNIDAVLAGIACKSPIYFVASEHLLRGGLGAKFVMRYFQPIIHTKGKTGVKTLSEMMKTLKAGKNVALFPEGNRSFNGLTCEIPENTGRVAKKSGASIITYRMEGGYFTHPRWSVSVRRGKMHGKLVHVYSPGELEQMDDGAINAAIEKDLFEDAYDTQERFMAKYKGKKLCLGLESTLFMCPECKAFSSLTSDENHLTCKACGFDAKYTEYGYLETKDSKKYTITEIDKEQRKLLEQLYNRAGEDEVLFEDDISVFTINENHVPVDEVKGHLTAYKSKVEFNGKTIPAEDIYGLSITSRNILGVHLDGGKRQMEIRCGIPFNGLKYVYLYKLNGKR